MPPPSETSPPSGVRMVFQPVVDLRSGRIISFEALARFDATPYRPPDEWFRDAHGSGVGIALECHAIELALGALATLPRAQGLGVNASPVAIVSGRVAALLVRFDPRRVTVEVTEHSEVDDYDALKQRLAELRALGARVAVDDAGAGISRLPHIARIWPDVIKLDRGLTEAAGRAAEAAGHTRAVVNFAEEFGVEVIAEGVETPDELDAMRRHGVRFGQGFHLGRPEPLEHWLAQ